MSKVLLDLEDCQITVSGEVFFKYETIVDLLRRKISLGAITTLPHRDIEFYNRRNPQKAIHMGEPTDTDEAPPVSSYKFSIPENYLDIDLDEYLGTKLVERFGNDPSAVYVDRLGDELQMMRDRSMEDFIRTLIYMVDVFERHHVVHGVGRGSSCASLVLFLIGIHMVDPIKYEIPIIEFLR